MASTIKIKNSSTAGAIPTSSDLVQGELAVNVTDKTIFTENASGTVVELGKNYTGFKNRIINGAMMIDQRNAGAAVTTSNSYAVDRFIAFNLTDGAFSAQRDTVAPVGFTNSLKWTTTTADASLSADQRSGLVQAIEGFNTADLGWGTANAQAVTISFWVRSSLTGTFGGSLRNSGASRSYIFSYTISAANTWEYKTVTVAGDTTGTWLTDNNAGIQLGWSFGVGSNFQGTAGAWQSGNLQNFSGGVSVIGTLNATWQVTGVQLEKGSTATSFDYRPYGTELALCQRYYYRIKSENTGNVFGSAWASTTTSSYCITQFPVTMRTAPTGLEQSGTASDYAAYLAGTSTSCSSVPTFTSTGLTSASYAFTTFVVASGLTAGQGGYGRATSTNAYLGWSAEL